MSPPRAGRPKVKIGVSLDADLYEWVLERIGPGGEFASVSHAVERALAAYQRDSAGRDPHGRHGKAES